MTVAAKRIPMTDEQHELAVSSEWVVNWWMGRTGIVLVNQWGYDRDDLEQVCRQAICLATQRFDPSIGKWSTFVCKTVILSMRTHFDRRRGELVRPYQKKKIKYVPPCVISIGDDFDTPESIDSEPDVQEALLEALAQLPEPYRTAVDMKFGVSDRIERGDAEIAKVIGTTRLEATRIILAAIAELKRLINSTSRA